MAVGDIRSQTISVRGHGGDEIDAYYARPEGSGPFPGVVVIQHIFGVDEWYGMLKDAGFSDARVDTGPRWQPVAWAEVFVEARA